MAKVGDEVLIKGAVEKVYTNEEDGRNLMIKFPGEEDYTVMIHPEGVVDEQSKVDSRD